MSARSVICACGRSKWYYSECCYRCKGPLDMRVRLERRTRRTETGCWEWTGSRCKRHPKFPYGIVVVGQRRGYPGKICRAHRVAWEVHNGLEIPPGMCVLHRCDNPPCINPAHLFLGTLKDNSQDMKAKGRGVGWMTARTHCKNGHEFTPENTRLIVRRAGRARVCRACERIFSLRKRGKLVEANP